MARKTELAQMLAIVVGLAILTPAHAASDLCRQLDAQSAGGALGGGGHLDEYDLAIAEQQQQLLMARDRTAEAGCSFSMVGAAIAYCAKLNARIDEMEANLDKLLRHHDRSPAPGTNNADDQLLALLAANGCDTGDGKDANAGLIEEIFAPEAHDEITMPKAGVVPSSVEAFSSPVLDEKTPSPSMVTPETRTPPKPAAPRPTMSSSEMPNEEALPHQPDPDRKIRVVGPMFLPDPEAAIDLQAPAPRQVR